MIDIASWDTTKPRRQIHESRPNGRAACPDAVRGRKHGLVNVPRLPDVGAKVDPDNLISAAEVRVILGLSQPNSVTTYVKRYANFPQPVVDLSSSRARLWRRQDIIRWHNARVA